MSAVKDTPLSVKIVDSKLVIEIGVDTLAFADAQRRNMEREWNEELKFTITDPLAFAGSVVRELTREDELGATELTNLLDEAMDRAIDNGAEGVETE